MPSFFFFLNCLSLNICLDDWYTVSVKNDWIKAYSKCQTWMFYWATQHLQIYRTKHSMFRQVRFKCFSFKTNWIKTSAPEKTQYLLFDFVIRFSYKLHEFASLYVDFEIWTISSIGLKRFENIWFCTLCENKFRKIRDLLKYFWYIVLVLISLFVKHEFTRYILTRICAILISLALWMKARCIFQNYKTSGQYLSADAEQV